MKRIVFSGDRKSKTIAVGHLLAKIFGKKRIYTMLWDGYPSKIYFQEVSNASTN